jgi:hypothetical protein
MGWLESTRCAETIVRVDEVQAVFAIEKAAGEIDSNIDAVCIFRVFIFDECCMKRGGSALAMIN